MTTIRIIVTLKPGVLDAQGQAVQQGLRALGYESVGGVRVGKCIELAVPDEMPPETLDAMCERFLANPLIEEWRVGRDEDGEEKSRSRVPAFPRSRGVRGWGSGLSSFLPANAIAIGSPCWPRFPA